MSFHAVIMAGGSGTRFWPLSRRQRPKQVLPILGAPSMVRRTFDRLGPLFDPSRILVVTSREHAALIREELPALPAENLIEEPAGRDTAAAIGLAAAVLSRRDPSGSFCVLPADHFIDDPRVFQGALEAGRQAARGGALVTFGIPPRHPATCYGYLQRGEPLGPGLHQVKRFCEKPPLETARAFVAGGEHYWNGGIFVWEIRALLEALERFLPDLSAALGRIGAAWGTPGGPAVLEREYAALKRVSVDYGVMEKSDRVVMLEAPFGWDDVGSWSAAADRRPQDADGNAIEGDVVAVDSRRSLVISAAPGHVIGVLGLDGVVVVHTPDATLVCPRERAEDLKALVEALKAKGHEARL
jgi:mannose-1-phosphate guanylyltransferase